MDKVSRYAAFGIVSELLYGAAVALFMVTKTEAALTLWELMSVFGAVALLVIITGIAKEYHIKEIFGKFLMICLSGTLFLTAAAHFTSIGVTRRLMADGIDIPDFYKIGMFPSYEMTLDYTAWGFFMGLAFLSMFSGVDDKMIKTFSMISFLLCFTGFIGSFFFDFLWYPAPLGYVAVFTIMLICLIRKGRKSSQG